MIKPVIIEPRHTSLFLLVAFICICAIFLSLILGHQEAKNHQVKVFLKGQVLSKNEAKKFNVPIAGSFYVLMDDEILSLGAGVATSTTEYSIPVQSEGKIITLHCDKKFAKKVKEGDSLDIYKTIQVTKNNGINDSVNLGYNLVVK